MQPVLNMINSERKKETGSSLRKKVIQCKYIHLSFQDTGKLENICKMM